MKPIIRFVLRSLLLVPAAGIYWVITFFRNKCYDWGFFKQSRLPVKVISIGNLSTGGTGKTIVAEFLMDFLHQKGLRVAYLSRGYGRATKGYIRVLPDTHTFREVGDEALQVATKFPQMIVAVCENRVKGVEALLKDYTLDVVILDDAFQHRRIARDMDILMMDINKVPWKNHILPLGLLREPLRGIRRADIVMVSKVTEEKQVKPIESYFKKRFKDKKVVFTGISAQHVYRFQDSGTPLLPDDFKQTAAVVFSGLGNNDQFEHHIRRYAIYSMRTYRFRDHHPYREKDIERILQRYKIVCRERHIKNKPFVITTEKDYNRLRKEPWLWDAIGDAPFYYMSVNLNFYKYRSRLIKLLNIQFPEHVAEEAETNGKS
ncbi:MAG: tetraacyldisaccharide 4'-kinase [Bacteroidetes bacterium]|nr:tetraacyldisaccharide 4'-kinase [Bacteroidota bacterium]